ncbi:MAG: hypothetical protein M1820_003511 [Bogoriella megaspora]|nr:MAG: hypothetical protein M1820_003511 [Bogoriella megaspora]
MPKLRRVRKDIGLAKLTNSPEPPMQSHFLDLPIELRLQIYEYVLLDAEAITIASASVVGSFADILHHLTFGSKRHPGLPRDHEPIVKQGYHRDLISYRDPPKSIIKSDARNTWTTASCAGLPTPSLLLLNHQISTEISSLCHLRKTSLFVSYPYGIHVLTHSCPHLLHRAKSLHIAGAFLPVKPSSSGPSLDEANAHMQTLTALLRRVADPKSMHHLSKVELRIYYPGYRGYSEVWGNDMSPITVALANTNGKIDMSVYKGNMQGSGVHVSIVPQENRNISCRWRNLKKDEETKDWCVGESWPAYEEEEEEVKGPADRFIFSKE